MATSDPRRALAIGAVLCLTLSGCAAAGPMRRPAGSFAWLGMGAAPWSGAAATEAGRGALPRPPGWRVLRGDRGSVSFVALGAGRRIVGYLNATPRSGAETIANWTRFRVRHNTEEGDRNVRLLDDVTGLRAGAARISCVIDDYRTTLSRYRELACLVVRPRTGAVVLGAAPPNAWRRQRPIIERAIAAFVSS